MPGKCRLDVDLGRRPACPGASPPAHGAGPTHGTAPPRDGSALRSEDSIAYALEEPPARLQTHGELVTQRLGIAEKGGTKSSATACAFVWLRDDR